jgi:hypothetical protein
MTEFERETVSEALADLKRLDDALFAVWSNIDYRLGIPRGGMGKG